MSEWEKVELGSIMETLKGNAFKSSEYTSSGVPIVRVSDFTDNSISTNEIMYYTEENAKKHPNYVLKHWDILIQTVGSWQHNPASIVGKVVKVPKELDGSLLNQNIVKIIPSSIVNNKFLYYRLKDESFKFYNLGCAQGAANQASITLATIRKFSFQLPPLSTQKRIASILSAYDDLIENNLKRIKLLEELAQRTYEEWFVNRTIQNFSIDDKDFEIIPLREMVLDYMNGGWGKEEVEGNYSEEAYVLRGTDMPDLAKGNFSNLPLRFHTKNNLQPRKLVTGDISIEMSNGNINNIGRSYFYDGSIETVLKKPVLCASFCKMLRPKNVNFAYLIDLHLKYIQSNNSMFIYKAQAANGINNFKFEDMINEETIAVPKGKHLEIFINNIKDNYIINSNLRQQISLLKESRDILLPRLMSGKIDITSTHNLTTNSNEFSTAG